MKEDELKIGERVRCTDTNEIGIIAALKTAEECGFPEGAPMVVFIETDAEKKSGIVREPGCLERMQIS